MLNLSLFSIESEGWKFEILPNHAEFSENEEEISLEIEGAYGVVNTTSKEGLKSDISYSNESELLQPIRFKENVEYEFSITMPFSKKQFKKYKSETNNHIFPFENTSFFKSITLNSLHGDKEDKVSEKYLITGRINFHNYVGVVFFEFFNNSLNFTADVVTKKILYEEEFQSLLNELAKIHDELIFRLDSPAEALLKLGTEEEPTPMAEFFHFKRLMREDKLLIDISTIIGNPASRHEQIQEIENTAFVTKPDFIELQSNPTLFDWVGGGPLSKTFRGYTPTTLPSYNIIDNLNIIENQFVKQTLKTLVLRIDNLTDKINSRKYAPTHLSLAKWRETLITILNHSFWKNISDSYEYPNSMVMQERIGYRGFMQSIMSFNFGLILNSSMDEIDAGGNLKPIFDLYENWCFIQLYEILCSLCDNDLGEPPITLLFKDNGFKVDLKRGENSYIEFHLKSNPQIVLKLYYIKEFKPFDVDRKGWIESYSGAFHPDFSIEIVMPDETHWIHFDAKYKLDYKLWQNQLKTDPPKNSCQNETSYKRNDLHVMHAYKDALLGARGCYILYPGNEENPDLFVRHGDPGYRKNNSIPSVGAFPIKPCEGNLKTKQINQLQSHIKKILQEMITHVSYDIELGFIL